MAIDGAWQGFYAYPSQSGRSRPDNYPITALFQTHGDRITGRMWDGETSWETPFTEIVQDNRESWSETDVKIAEMIVERTPEVTYKSSLPTESELLGTCKPPIINFVKKYIGVHESLWSGPDGEHLIHRTSSHKVFYVGTLNEDETVIEGTWFIREPGMFGRWRKPNATATFRLERK